MNLPKYKLSVSPGGITAQVDGQDVPAPRAVSLVSEAGGVPTLTLEYPSIVEIEGEGVVQVLSEPTDEDVFGILAGWLASLNVDELLEVVNSRMMTLRDNPVKKTIEVLTEMAQEYSNG